MAYYIRIAVMCCVLATLIGIVIWRGPQVRDIALVATSPIGDAASTGTAISLTFSRAVDRQSAEESFALTPSVEGRFFWDGQTMTFRPHQTLMPNTAYEITIDAELRDAQGRPNEADQGWNFRTRASQLLFVGSEAGTPTAIWLAAGDGTNARPIHTEPEGITNITLAPSGEQALYVAQRGPQRRVLVVLNLDDGSSRPLVDDPAASASGPAWSPLGDLIAFERGNVVGSTVGQLRVWLAQPDGTSLGPLYGEQTVSYAPVWSPGGDKIALLNGVEQTVDVYDFTNNQRSFPDHNGEPVSWSPDGAAFVYTSAMLGEDGPRLRLRVITLANDEARDLTDGAVADSSPAWSPDGEWIVFSRREEQGPGSTLWLMRPDGSDQRQITSAGPYQDMQPVWSPDSQQIAFIRSSIGGTLSSAAWIVDREGGEPWLVLEHMTQVVWVP